jgi:pectinesterase
LAKEYDFIVAKDGTGNYLTIQSAINAVPDYRKKKPTRIFIKKGIYKERINIPGRLRLKTLPDRWVRQLTNDADYAIPVVLGGQDGWNPLAKE